MFTHTGCFCNVPRNGTQAVPYGFAGGRCRSTAQVLFVTLLGDESSPIHCVIPFIRMSYIRNVPPFCHSGLERQRSGGIYPSCRNNLRKVKLATREDSSTRIRSLGMTRRGVIPFCPHRLYLQRGGRQIAAPTDTPVGDTVQPHGLYSEHSRNGTQAVPYVFASRWFRSTPQVVFGTWRAADCR